jgi:hypothetical protein
MNRLLFGDNLKWLSDLTEDEPESRDLTPMPLDPEN